jgi:hypothetical protein
MCIVDGTIGGETETTLRHPARLPLWIINGLRATLALTPLRVMGADGLY